MLGTFICSGRVILDKCILRIIYFILPCVKSRFEDLTSRAKPLSGI